MKRLALVTGGTRGIGLAISNELSEKGYQVVASYGSNHESAQKFSASTGIDTVCFDVSNEDQCVKACESIANKYGTPIEVLVHNAGITADATVSNMTAEQWHSVINTNLNSCFFLTKAVLPGMKAKKYGRLLYLSSVNGLKGQRGQANYAASKAALIGFAKSVALEMANKFITANVIAPGYIDTDMVRAVPADVLEKIINQIPIGRLGKVEEISHVVSFLADERAGFITGATISANGGMY